LVVLVVGRARKAVFDLSKEGLIGFGVSVR